MTNDLAIKYLKVYSNLPLAVREEVVVVVGNEPLSWNALRLEVENNTPKGLEGLKTLTELHII